MDLIDPTLEACFNIWYFYDEETSVVLQSGVKAYTLTGTDEEKIRTLKALARTDFLSVRRRRIPERFAIVSDDGERRTGAIPATSIDDADLTVEIVHSLLPLPAHLSLNPHGIAYRVEVGEHPLYVATFVCESSDGTIRPVVGDEPAPAAPAGAPESEAAEHPQHT